MANDEIDNRPLSEIRFAIGNSVKPYSAKMEAEIRKIFEKCGVKIAQDIVDLGCTGLVKKLMDLDLEQLKNLDGVAVPAVKVELAKAVRANMDGSICGLPCYVPNSRFCLVHDTLGGLQDKQVPRNVETVPFLSRELTEYERKHLSKIYNKMHEEVGDELKFDSPEVEGVEEVAEKTDAVPASCPVQRPFKCQSHDDFVANCRFCLAQAIVEGPLVPNVEITAENGSRIWNVTPERLQEVLSTEGIKKVTVCVLAAQWTMRMSRG